MLLSAKRSCLVLPATPGGVGRKAEGDRPTANLFLLESAARRLQVPVFNGDASAKQAVTSGRDQLVLAMDLPSPAVSALPGAVNIFVVVDALPEADRPSSTELIEAGITPVTTEMVVFEWLERADSDDFRALLKLIR